MKVFGQYFENGKIVFKEDNFVVKINVEQIFQGYIIKGEIKGKPGRIEVFRFQVPERFLINNWQSWGPTKVLERGRKIDISEDLVENMRYGINPHFQMFKKYAVSDYFYGTNDLFVGFLSSRYAHPFFIFDKHEVVGYLDYFDSEYKDFIPLEPLVIFKGNIDAILPMYADYVKIENSVSLDKVNPVGWSSWYQYFLTLDWKEVLKNLEFSKGYPYEIFQIDDSWEIDIGDWTPNEKFPSLEEMAQTIKKYGFTPGIWLAPFSISETSSIFERHKDWLVKDKNGEPVLAYKNWKKNIYALDVTNPEVIRWLKRLFRKFKEAGFDYFKIDFLFAGAVPGKRYLNVSPIEAYRLGLKVIKETVNDSFVLGCGAPLLPSVGLVDGMRIGPDTAPYYKVQSCDEFVPNAFYALRNTITRYFMNGKWWWNDPDCFLLRNEKTQLNMWEKKAYAFVAGMLNNMIIQSDDLSLPVERYLLYSALKLRNGRPFVKGLMENVYEITAEGTNIGNVWMRINLKRQKSEFFVDKNKLKLFKCVEVREDGRKFNYYSAGNNEREGGSNA